VVEQQRAAEQVNAFAGRHFGEPVKNACDGIGVESVQARKVVVVTRYTGFGKHHDLAALRVGKDPCNCRQVLVDIPTDRDLRDGYLDLQRALPDPEFKHEVLVWPVFVAGARTLREGAQNAASDSWLPLRRATLWPGTGNNQECGRRDGHDHYHRR